MAITTTTDLLSGSVFLSATVTVMIIFFLIKRFRLLVPLATFWIFLFLGRSNPYPQCFIRERSHLVLFYCARQVLPGSDFVFEGTIWLSCCQCHVAATHGQIRDALGGHSRQTSAVSRERFSCSAERSAWQSWLEAMRSSDIAVLDENQQDVQQEKILIMDLQWSNTFCLCATSEEGPHWIKFWEPGFRHSFIAPRQDFKAVMCQKPALALRLNECCSIPAFWGRVLSPGTATGQQDRPYSCGNPAPPEAWLFDTNFSRTRLSSYVWASISLASACPSTVQVTGATSPV